MAGRMTIATRAPEPASSPPSEHIYIGSDDSSPNPASARTVREHAILRNALRRTQTEVTIYDEGFVKVAEFRSGKADEPFRLDLHYLDPVPTITRVIAARALYVALGCAGMAALAALLMRFEVLRPFALPTALAAAVAALAALALGIYRSHERTEFCTIHGRAPVLRLVANLGSIKKFRAFVPALSRAIDESAEKIGTDTAAYLRAEMREHYRLRGDGVLSTEICADSTGRILAQFDIQL